MKVYGVLGDERVRHSLSPAMHNAVLRNHGLSGVYLAFAVSPRLVPEAVAGLRGLGIAGVNVTVPHKESVARCLDRLSSGAERLGAVNTIVNRDGMLEGHNTDVDGFADAVARAGGEIKGRTALVFGAGGAARALVFALGRGGAARVLVAGRTRGRVERLTRELGGEAISLQEGAGAALRVDLLVNATAASTRKESAALADLAAGIRIDSPQALVMDINYGREGNFWEHMAKASGVRFQDGLAMLALQARRSFILWTGVRAREEEFLEALPCVA